MKASIRELAHKLRTGKMTSAALVESCIAAAADGSESVFITLNAEQARSEALQVDKARRDGLYLPYFAGVPITLKDLFDVEGEVTAAGSRVLAFNMPAQSDATVIARLRESGFIFLGRVNMSEFAFSGMGANPHYGTPLSIWDRSSKRLPGGSSSGSAVGVAEGTVPASIGSDTAGSTRIPAAFNGVVGFKPSYGRLPLDGIFPLSPTTDAPGPLANTVDCCYLLDSAMSGEKKPQELNFRRPEQLKFLVPEAQVTEELDPTVRKSFERALDFLESAGCSIKWQSLPVLDALLDLFQTSPLATFEAWRAHRQRLESSRDAYDPFVSTRIASGADISERDYRATLRKRRELIDTFNNSVKQFDALIYPTVPILPPRLAEIVELEAARKINFRCLRNTATVNYFDGCAISLPCHQIDGAPVGMMVSTTHNRDKALFEIAATVERLLYPARR